MEIGEREGKDLSGLVRKVEAHEHPGGRTSAMRVFVMEYFRVAATEAGHAAAGHGAVPSARYLETMRMASPAMPPPTSPIEEARNAA